LDHRYSKRKGSIWLLDCFYKFLATTYTTTENVDLVWEDFAYFYTFMYSSIHLLEHSLAQFSNLLHFLDFWVVYKKEKGILWFSQNIHHQKPRGWDQEKANHEYNCASKVMNQHVGPTFNIQGEFVPWAYIK
jgi:hypothetical protein